MINKSQGFRFMNAAVFIPRLWIIVLALAIPFFLICSTYLEALERTGTVGAMLADMLLSVTIVGYLVFIFMLKTRKR